MTHFGSENSWAQKKAAIDLSAKHHFNARLASLDHQRWEKEDRKEKSRGAREDVVSSSAAEDNVENRGCGNGSMGDDTTKKSIKISHLSEYSLIINPNPPPTITRIHPSRMRNI